MLILITSHIQAEKKSKWLISSNTPRICPSLPAFSKVTARFLLKNVNQRIFYSALPSLPSILDTVMLRTKSEFLTHVLQGPTRPISFLPISSLLPLSILLAMLQSSWLSCYSSNVHRFFIIGHLHCCSFCMSVFPSPKSQLK